GARHRNAELAGCIDLLATAKPQAGRLAILAGLAEGLARTERPLRAFLAEPPASLKDRVPALEPLLQSARQLATAEREESSRRVLAIQLLTRAKPETARQFLPDLLQPRQPQPVQFAAARGIGEVADKTLAGSILDHWGTYTTSTRRELQTALLQSPALALALLDAVEQEKIAAAELDPATQAALQRIPDTALRTRAAKLLSKAISADRQAVVRKYESALTLAGDGGRGAALFAKNCLICHQMQGQGHAVGPDLSGVGSQPKEALLNDILDPSREVSGDYLNYVLVTKRGQVLTGLLASETANSVRLRRAEGAEDTVLRSEIEDLRLTGKSLMPEGLEQTLSVRDVADILEFLQHPSALPSPAKK
ncbi:MAG TPA: c-type cytochrome, partial [Gemmataceae bacterium]|nr:c-type cytochrome [Gemmataceae bacterium]